MSTRRVKFYNTNYSIDLKIEVYYEAGGDNGYKFQKRGFYLSVAPVKREKIANSNFISETYEAWTGSKLLLMETKMFTAKKFEEAQKMAKEREADVIQYVVQQNSLTKKEGV
jgi:hypothetical protein